MNILTIISFIIITIVLPRIWNIILSQEWQLEDFGIKLKRNQEIKMSKDIKFLFKILRILGFVLIIVSLIFCFAYGGWLISVGRIKAGIFYISVGILSAIEAIVYIKDY